MYKEKVSTINIMAEKELLIIFFMLVFLFKKKISIPLKVCNSIVRAFLNYINNYLSKDDCSSLSLSIMFNLLIQTTEFSIKVGKQSI